MTFFFAIVLMLARVSILLLTLGVSAEFEFSGVRYAGLIHWVVTLRGASLNSILHIKRDPTYAQERGEDSCKDVLTGF